MWLGLGLFGAAIGIVFFGSLGVIVHVMVRHPGFAPLIGPAVLARFVVLGCVLAVVMPLLGQGGAGSIVAVLGGLTVGRWVCLRWMGVQGLGA